MFILLKIQNTVVISSLRKIMAITFSRLYPLNQIAEIDCWGAFNPYWNGDYDNHGSQGKRYQQPSTGSGFHVGRLNLLNPKYLPGDIREHMENAQENQGNGWIYVIRSTRYNTLYVGISSKSLAKGVFGDGRFVHHLRKLIAAKGGATNHTKGWRGHAIDRYQAMKQAAESDSNIPFSSLTADLLVAVAHVPDPTRHEKAALETCRQAMSMPTVLNTASSGEIDNGVRIDLPENFSFSIEAFDGSSETAEASPHIEHMDFEELEDYEADTTPGNDYAEYTSQMDEECKTAFLKVLEWARKTTARHDPGITEAIVAGYINQPPGYNAIPLLNFARRGDAGKALGGQWFARIPLVCQKTKPMTVILPLRLKNDSLSEDKISLGRSGSFRPVDLEDFLNHPQSYIAI